MQLVWYCSFCSIGNQFCVVQFILIFFLFTMFTQCPWLVHVMVPACCSKSFGSLICVVDVSSEQRFNVLSIVMHPVDMGRFILPLCFIIWCRLLDPYVAQTVHICIFFPTSIYNYDLKLNTSQRLFMGRFSPNITL